MKINELTNQPKVGRNETSLIKYKWYSWIRKHSKTLISPRASYVGKKNITEIDQTTVMEKRKPAYTKLKMSWCVRNKKE